MSVYRAPGVRAPEPPEEPPVKKKTSFEIRLEEGYRMQRRERLRQVFSVEGIVRIAFGVAVVGLASFTGPFAPVVVVLGAIMIFADVVHYRR